MQILQQIAANEAHRKDDASTLHRALLVRSVNADGLLLEHVPGANDDVGVGASQLLLDHGTSVGQLEPLNLFEHTELEHSTETQRIYTPVTAAAGAATTPPATAASGPDSAPTAHVDLATALAHITDPAQCAALITTLQERQNAADAADDAADLSI
jgi:hypothetical protein